MNETLLISVIKDILLHDFSVEIEPVLSVPSAEFGDYSTNIAMQIAGKLGKNPREVAEIISKDLSTKGYRSEVAGPGFINIWLRDTDLWSRAVKEPQKKLIGQSWVVEYSCPNYFKEIHVGHLYQTLVGDVVARLIERAGARVHRTNFGADVGLSAARAMWGILMFLGGENPEKLDEISSEERMKFIAEQYVRGAKADTDELDVTSSEEIKTINKRIYEMHATGDVSSRFAQVYLTTRQWCKDYFIQLYKQIGVSEFEKYYPESVTQGTGLELVRAHPQFFENSDQATVFKGEQYGLHTRVFITQAGLPTYETKDLGLIFIEKDDFQFNHRVLITGNDQYEYMKVVWKAADLIEPGLATNMTHLTNGTIRFGDGKKMSSRLGNVTRAVDVLNAVKNMVEPSNDLVRDNIIALGAVKYEFLKYRLGGDIAFDPESSVSLQGNSGPYLQYAYVRAISIINKSQARPSSEFALLSSQFEKAERELIRKIGDYEAVIERATAEFAPHYICTYLYELAQTFNRFYEQTHVIGSEQELSRIELVKLYASTLKDGLSILGISVLKQM